MMQATYAVIPDELQVEIKTESISEDELQEHEVLFRAEASVVSAGTELAILTSTAPGTRTPGSWNAYPWRPGYGAVGHVVASAADQFSAGQRIFCFGKHASLQKLDVSAEKPQNSAFVIDEDLPPEVAAMLRMVLVAITGPQVTEISEGDTVAVFGLGAVGNFAAQLYQIAGANVLAFDPVASRCEIARQCGIQQVFDVPPQEQITVINDLTSGQGVNVAVDAVGDSRIIKNCVMACADHGQVILLGSPRVAHHDDVTQYFREVHNRWLSVKGALEWRLPPYSNNSAQSIEGNLQLIVDYFKSGKLQVAPVITHIVSPNELSAAYHGLLNERDQYLGVVVDWE